MLFALALLLGAALEVGAQHLKFQFDKSGSSSSSSSSSSDARGHRKGHNHQWSSSKTSTSDSSGSDSSSASSGDSELPESSYDYVFVGGGMGSVSAAYWLADSLKRCGRPVSVAVIEKQNYIGGNVYDVPLKMPPAHRYDGSFGLQMMAGLGALRIPQLANGLERREFVKNNITVYWSPFRNDVNMRGVRRVCEDPFVHAAGALDNPYKYGDFCNSDVPFVNAANDDLAIYKGFDKFNMANLVSEGASGAVWLYMLKNTPHLTGETDIDANNNWIFNYGGVHPITGLECEPTGVGSLPHCPVRRTAGRDWRRHMELEVRDDPMPALNTNVSRFMQADGVGFAGDLENTYSARALAEYNVFEWNTNSFNAYPINGMSSLTHAMVDSAKANGVQFFTDEKVLNIDSAARPGALYDLKTSRRRVRVRKFLGLNLPRYYLFPSRHDDANFKFAGADLSGSIVDRLRAVREVQAPTNARSLKIIIQYEPGHRNWFWNVLDNVNGNYSYRQYGDTTCSARLEIVDTPFHRCANFITAVYSDAHCLRDWQTRIQLYEQTNDINVLRKPLLENLATSFPEYATEILETIPVLTRYRLFESAWTYLRTGYDDVGMDDVAALAPAPLGASERLSLIGEGYFTRRSGWIEGAMRSAKRTVERIANLDGFGPATTAVFDDLFEILKDSDGGISDSSPFASTTSAQSSFGYMPVAFQVGDRDTSLMAENEKWGPFGPYNTPGYDTDSCRPSLYGVEV